MGRRLLVVQAQQAPRGVNLAALSNAGYELKLVPATAAHASNLEPEIDAIVLDGLDDAGWAFLREAVDADLRRPRVVCSAGQPSSAIIGMLDIGVACHLTFDVSERELLARIEWACARAQTQEPTTVPVLEIDDVQRRVWLNGKSLDLPRREFDVLALLVMNSGRLLPRERLMQSVWGPDHPSDSRSLDVRVSRIRKALRDGGGQDGPYVETVPGVGYRLVM